MKAIIDRYFYPQIEIKTWRKIFTFFIRPIVHALTKIKFNAVEEIPSNDAFILDASNLSFFDGFIL